MYYDSKTPNTDSTGICNYKTTTNTTGTSPNTIGWPIPSTSAPLAPEVPAVPTVPAIPLINPVPTIIPKQEEQDGEIDLDGTLPV